MLSTRPHNCENRRPVVQASMENDSGAVGFFEGVPLRLGTGLWDAYECRVVR